MLCVCLFTEVCKSLSCWVDAEFINNIFFLELIAIYFASVGNIQIENSAAYAMKNLAGELERDGSALKDACYSFQRCEFCS